MLAATVVAALSATADPAEPTHLTRTRWVMGTYLTITIPTAVGDPDGVELMRSACRGATAEAAAERALRIIASERVASGSIIARVHESLCALCERCIEACPYNARMLDPEGERILVNPVMCQGCGACADICPNDAAYVEGFDASQVMDVIDAAIN